MSDRARDRRQRNPRSALRGPGSPAKNTLSSREVPDFGIFGPLRRKEVKSSGTFRVPSPTTSDEEDIEEQERQLMESSSRDGTQTPTSSLATPGSEHLSQLGGSSSLFSEQKRESPSIRSVLEIDRPKNKDTKLFVFPSLNSPEMVREQEPPKATPQKTSNPPLPNIQPPQFGQPSPLGNRLQQPRPQPKEASIFNIPKPHQQRPEHHRPVIPAASNQPAVLSHGQHKDMQPLQSSMASNFYPSATGDGQPGYQNYARPVAPSNHIQPGSQPVFIRPFQQPVSQRPLQPQPNTVQNANAQLPAFQGSRFDIPKPTNAPTWNTYSKPQPTFSAYHSDGNAFGKAPPRQVIDLTGTGSKTQSSFDPPGLFDDRFGATDPNLYVDEKQAADNIKSLLEGAFDDDDEKPRTRGRRKKMDEKADALANRLGGLNVKEGSNQEETKEDQEDEEEIDDGTVEGLKIKLLPHQVEGVEWMKDKENGVQKKNRTLPKGGILADDMGLGKTIQSISLILTNPRPSRSTGSSSTTDLKDLASSVGKSTLVVAPLALIKQWEGELWDRVEDSHRLKVLVHHGPQRTKSSRDLQKYDVVITTYQILVSEHGNSSPREDGPQVGCFGIHWYRVILDEAHSIKNCNAKSTKACYALRSEYRWCLTGTPMQNNLDELQSLIRFLRIKPYNDIAVWKDQITRPMNQGRGGVAMKRLQFYLKAFMKRRTKEILKKEGALNPGGKDGANQGFKIVQRKVESLFAEFSPDEQQFYDRLEQRTDQRLDAMMSDAQMSYASALVLLLRLRQACNHPKLLGVSLSQDSEALTTEQNSPTKKIAPATKDVDDMADLLSGLSVQTKQCDVCQVKLSDDLVSAGMTRCSECEEDLASQLNRETKGKSKKIKKRISYQDVKSESKAPRKNKKNVIVDSDDEEGEWIVHEDQRHSGYLGKAGGSDDENAEGGGESLASSDSETDDDESSVQILGSHHRKAISVDSDESSADTSGSDSSHSEDGDGHDSRDPPLLASAKIRHLLQLLHAESSTHKFIVYSQFTSMLDLIAPFLLSANLAFTCYDGRLTPTLRERALHSLRNDPHTRILLCSLKCGSLGLNLTAATRVVILEPFWNPFVEEQAIDRVHRLNQTVDVVVYKLTVRGTVEGRILELQERKRALAREAIESGGAAGGAKGAGKLSMMEILGLFRRDAETEVGIARDDISGGLTGIVGQVRDMGLGNSGTTGGVGSSRRVTPPANRKPAVRSEDPTYGRRW